MSFLDIDQILAEDERLPCVFSVEAKDLGFLDPSIHSDDLPAHSKVDLPLWLAQTFAEKNMIEIDIPKHYGKYMRDEIMAGPANLRLKDFSNYFIEVGLKLSRITRDDDLLRAMRTAFSGERYQTLMVRSLSGGHDDHAEYAQELTSIEFKLFTIGNTAVSDLCNWRSREASILKEATILSKKRSNVFDESNRKRDK
eukprot:CAMPEP_0182423056 /NCGR_PEP_ID=MMETSP1167-20130531/8958_1 /TAXON_ID=2988 /ORGANISM="Mallomonas Sp, Strain CCMP3275" /LENGTH=196 /DNA_ID=CAMNT_0024601677 /DNA_START=127 /DNA_END=714 /DNA_ORIENTATION=-